MVEAKIYGATKKYSIQLKQRSLRKLNRKTNIPLQKLSEEETEYSIINIQFLLFYYFSYGSF